jgi:TPR repeat protein
VSNSQFNLGFIFTKGQVVTQDYKQAVKWYTKAAEQGEPNAQVKLGLLYALGHGVNKDYIQSHAWLNVASANGDETAQEHRDLITKNMTAEQIAKAQELAKELFKKYQTK